MDDLNRLLTASIPSVYSHSWTYNPIGNMLTRNDNNGSVTYSYNDAAYKHAVTQAGANYFCYDANGNMTRRNATSSACTNGDALAYDAENRLTSITVGANTTTYLYDGDGNRVKKTANGVSTFYVGNHYEVTNDVATKYYYFGKQRVAMRTSAGVAYLHSDHLGSTSATSGASVSAQTYYAYGNIRSTTGTAPTDFGFTGQRRDASAGLMYYGAQGIYGRYYDPIIGHFTQPDMLVPDQMNPQTLNRYSYTFNNPLRYTDPNGHCPWRLIPLVGAFAGGGADLIVQMRFEGKSLNNIDWGRTGGAATGGAVFTTVMAMAPPTMIGAIGVGALAVALSGRVDDFTNASLDELWSIYNGGSFDQRRWIAEMEKEGIVSEIDDNIVAGAVSGITGKTINDFLISKGLMNSPATKTTLQNLQRRIAENNLKWDVGLKSWVSETSSRRIVISQSEWAAMFGETSREAYNLLSNLFSTLFGTGAKEQYKEIPEVEGLWV